MCNSRQDHGCGDPFDSDLISPSLFVECPKPAVGESLCVKVKSTSKYRSRLESLFILIGKTSETSTKFSFLSIAAHV